MKVSMTNNKVSGFPDLNMELEEIATRPMGLHEFPKQFQIDREMAIVGQHHQRIEDAIRTFWGHPDCVGYLQKLILSGGDGAGKSRIGFKAEVVSALMNLVTLHEVK